MLLAHGMASRALRVQGRHDAAMAVRKPEATFIGVSGAVKASVVAARGKPAKRAAKMDSRFRGNDDMAERWQ